MFTNVVLGFLSSGLLGALGWILTLSPRITSIETKHQGLSDLIKDKIDALHKLTEIQFENMDQRLSRIERSMNGHLKD